MVKQQQAVLWLALLINIVSVGGFMVVMPLGPEFTRDLGMDPAYTGYLSGGATFAAALTGLLLAPVLDRFNRKRALALCLTLKSVLLLLCTQAVSAEYLTLLYIVSGCFGGPAAALLMAAVLDVTPPPQRGRAMALVSAGFSVAAILVVPFSLAISVQLSWSITFYLLGGAGLVLAMLVGWLFPSLPGHTQPAGQVVTALARTPAFRLACLVAAVQMFGHFLLVPNFSAFFQFNLGFPRADIAWLYFWGGLASLFALQLSGILLDKGYAMLLVWGTSVIAVLSVFAGIIQPGTVSVYLFFILFMAATSARSSAVMAMFSVIPQPQQRAAYMSYQSTIANAAAGLGSIVSANWLSSDSALQLQGMTALGWGSIVCMLLLPVLVMCTVVRITVVPATAAEDVS